MSFALLVGNREGGKTTLCERLVELARQRGLATAGILARAIHRDGKRIGYRVIDLATSRSAVLATLDGPGEERVGRFHLPAEGLALGRAALEHAATLSDALVIVDEVGPLELSGGGWARQLEQLANRTGLTLLTVRRSLANEVAKAWNVPQDAVFEIAGNPEVVVVTILQLLAV